jgi:hypothetical protein
MSNCRGTYAFLTYLVAFSKLAAPRRKKRQVVSLLLRRESLSLYHEQEYMCSCVQWSGGCWVLSPAWREECGGCAASQSLRTLLS